MAYAARQKGVPPRAYLWQGPGFYTAYPRTRTCGGLERQRNLRFGVVSLSLLLYKLRAIRSKLDRVNGPCFCPGPTAPGALPLA